MAVITRVRFTAKAFFLFVLSEKSCFSSFYFSVLLPVSLHPCRTSNLLTNLYDSMESSTRMTNTRSASDSMMIRRSRRQNFAINSLRLASAQKLSGIPLYYSFYSDFSEVRFRKSLMTNNRYPEVDIRHFDLPKEELNVVIPPQDWSVFLPPFVNIDPSIKCASSWAVAVATIMYMKFKEMDPLWSVQYWAVYDPVGAVFSSTTP